MLEAFVFLFWFCIVVLLYTYFGYPIFIWVAERIFFHPVVKASLTPPVTVLIAAYNEETVIGEKIQSLLDLDYPRENLQIIVACDGSTDRTAEVVCSFSHKNVILHEHAVRRGKAAVLNDEVLKCDTDFIILADARQRFAPDSLLSLMSNFADPHVGAVSGELCLEGTDTPGVGQGMGFYWRYEKFIRRCESGIHSTVGATGAMLAIRTKLWRGLPPQTIVDDMVLPFQVVEQGYRVILDSSARLYDSVSYGWDREFSRKSRTLSGNFQILFHPFLMHAPLFSRLTWQFFSHKVLRLICPLFMVILFWSAYWLFRNALTHDMHEATYFYGLSLVAQGLLYFCGFLGYLGERFKIRLPVIPVVYSFLLTQVAIICGFLRWSSGRDDSIWEKNFSFDRDGINPQLVRIFADSTLFCFGIVLTFYLRYWGTPPDGLFQLFAKLNPSFAIGSVTVALPFVLFVPLVVFYFFHIHEKRTEDLAPEFFLSLVNAVFFCTLVMVVLIYKMRATLMAMEDTVMVGFPTLVLVLSFFVNCLLLGGWRLIWKQLRYRIFAVEGAWRNILLVCTGHPNPQMVTDLQVNFSRPTRITGFVGSPGFTGLPCLGDVTELGDVLHVGKPNGVYIEAGTLDVSNALKTLRTVDLSFTAAGIIPGDLELLLGRSRLQLISYIPVLDCRVVPAGEAVMILKRGIDILSGLLLFFSGVPAILYQWLGSNPAKIRVRHAVGPRGGDIVIRRACSPAGGVRCPFVRGLDRYLAGIRLLSGSYSLIGPVAVTRRDWRKANALERACHIMKPGLIGPKNLLVAGDHFISSVFLPVLYYGRNFNLGLDLVFFLSALGRWRQRYRNRMAVSGMKR